MNKKDQKILNAFRERMKAHLKPEVAARRWFEINNEDADQAEIRIYDEVSWFGVTAEDFATELEQITAPEILVMINSPGGDVFDGVAIYNLLRAHPAKITTRVDGVAASIASVIAQAGDRRIMLTGSQMMIHEAWGFAFGTADEMRAYADLLERQNVNIAGIYARRTGKEQDYFLDAMTNDKWMDAEETVAEGLADEVVDLPANAETAVDASQKKTLHDEVTQAIAVVSETLDSAERVAALRAEHDEHLSEKNRAGLGELADRIAALLPDDTETEVSVAPPPEEVDDGAIAEAARVEYLKYVASSL